MNDSSIPASKLIAAGLWTISFLVLAVSWVVWLWGYKSLAVMIGTTAVMFFAAATVAQVKCYSLRLCALVRADSGGRGSLHPMP